MKKIALIALMALIPGVAFAQECPPGKIAVVGKCVADTSKIADLDPLAIELPDAAPMSALSDHRKDYS
jgi:hypothetical protein